MENNSTINEENQSYIQFQQFDTYKFQCKDHNAEAKFICFEPDWSKPTQRLICDLCIQNATEDVKQISTVKDVFKKILKHHKNLSSLISNNMTIKVVEDQIQNIKSTIQAVRQSVLDCLQEIEDSYIQFVKSEGLKSIYINNSNYQLNELTKLINQPEILPKELENADNLQLLHSILSQTQSLVVYEALNQQLALVQNLVQTFLKDKLQPYKTLYKQNQLELQSQESTLLPFNVNAFQGQSQQIIQIKAVIWSILSLNDRQFITGGTDQQLKFWDLGKNKPYKSFFGHTGCIRSIIKLQDSLIASAGEDRAVKIWDWQQNICLLTLQQHTLAVRCLARIDRHCIASVSSDKSLKIWNWPDCQLVRSIEGAHKADINAVTLLNDKERLATGGNDQMLKIWKIADWSCLKVIDTSQHVMHILLLGNNYLSLSGFDGNIRIYKANDDYNQEKILTGHQGGWCIWSQVMLRDTYLASASNDTTIKIWQWQSENDQCAITMKEHTSKIYGLTTLGDKFLISSGHDKKIIIWK